MSKYIDGTRIVYFDDSNGNLTIPGTVFAGNLNASTTTVTNDSFGSIAGNFVHYDATNQRLVYNQTGGGGGGGTTGIVNASTVTTILDVVASGHLLGQETSQIVDYDFTRFGQTWNPIPGNHTYSGAALSATGKYQIVTADLQTVLISRDYGNTFSAATLPTIPFVVPALSATGQYMYVGANIVGGSIYRSSDYGVSWVDLGNPAAGNWISVACSADGKYVLGGTVGPVLSSNFGGTWTSLPSLPAGNWTIAVSATGQYMLGVTAGLSAYLSADFGSTWTATGPSANWVSCAISGNGKYAIAAATTTLSISSNYGITWTQTAYTSPGQVGVSFSGQYQIVAYPGASIRYSSDYGLTFLTASVNAAAAALSANGQYVLAGNNGGYLSSVPTRFPAGIDAQILNPYLQVSSVTASIDVTAIHVNGQETTQIVDYDFTTFGQTWTPNIGFGPQGSSRGAAMSATGKYQLFASLADLYLSSDYGSTFSSAFTAPVGIFVPAVSASGQYMYAGDLGGQIYASSNYGVTWSVLATSPSYGWFSVACSAEGRILLAGPITANVPQLSIDYGATWSPIYINQIQPWAAFSGMSTTGQYMLVGTYSGGFGAGQLHVSNNYGVTFTTVFPQGFDWTAVAVSGNGKYMTGAANAGTNILYCSSDYGVTWTNRNVQANAFFQVSIDFSGQYQLASLISGGAVYSSNFGASWTVQGLGDARGATISANAQYMLVSIINSYVYTSSVPTRFPAGVSGGTATFNGAFTISNIPNNNPLITTVNQVFLVQNISSVLYTSVSTTAVFLGTYKFPAAGGLPLLLNNNGGTVGINFTPGSPMPNAAYALDVRGTINALNGVYSNGTFLTSDQRVKRNVLSADVTRCFSTMKSIDLKYFQWDPVFQSTSQIRETHQLGFIAQDVKQVFPNSVFIHSTFEIDDFHSLDHQQLQAMHFGATQHLGALVETQSTQIAVLLTQVSTMNDAVSYIPQLTSTLKGLGH